MYGGSNEVFGKNENFPLVLDIKLHLKIPVNYQLQISPPPSIELMSSGSIDFYGLIIENYLAWGLQTEVNMSHVSLFILAAPPLFHPTLFLHLSLIFQISSHVLTRQ